MCMGTDHIESTGDAAGFVDLQAVLTDKGGRPIDDIGKDLSAKRLYFCAIFTVASEKKRFDDVENTLAG